MVGCGQKDIAFQQKISQGAVSARLKRARERLPYLKFIQEFQLPDDRGLVMDLGLVLDLVSIEILKCLAKTSCQTDTAKLVNESLGLTGTQKLTQVKVRHRFEKSLRLLEQATKKYPSPSKEIYTKYFFFFKYVKHTKIIT